MEATAPPRKIQAALFICAYNAVRSPMAEAIARHYFGRSIYVQSAGVHKGDLDPLMLEAMNEIGVSVEKHRPRTIEELEEWEGLNFDVIITLSPDAHHQALDLTRSIAADVEYWPTPDPTLVEGNREQRLDAYRQARDMLVERILARLKPL
ncbi:MAG: low molecular weight phosphatase family protein [Rhizobiales bacterium 65-9]|nr:arsenate reductase ArsC [Hyphomicrobiales bacterium]OJY36111.1 MAG: low molecular weight phosphatase family protein [Rhizobiales bacterium 65-9]